MTRRLARIAGVAAGLVALWLLWDTVLLYPLKLLVVLFHEVSHGLAAVATGGEIREIAVTAGQAGWCECPGGDAFVTLSAGYLGSLGFGAALLWAATARAAHGRWVLGALGLLLVGTTVAWVRRPLAVVLGLGAGVALAGAAARLGRRGRVAVLGVLGTTSCLYAVLDVKSDVLDRPGLESDAAALADLTGVPGVVWGVLWIGVSAVVLALLWRRVLARL